MKGGERKEVRSMTNNLNQKQFSTEVGKNHSHILDLRGDFELGNDFTPLNYRREQSFNHFLHQQKEFRKHKQAPYFENWKMSGLYNHFWQMSKISLRREEESSRKIPGAGCRDRLCLALSH